MTKNLKKIYLVQLEKNLYIFLIKNCHLLIPRPPERTSKLQEKASALKREHPALQNMTFLKFLLLLLWLIFALQIRIRIKNPDPDLLT
jgi:hypothetical protein